MLSQKRKLWSTSDDLIKSFKFRAGIQSDKISILNAVWEKELGHMAGYWSLAGVKKGTLFVKPRSSAAAQELHMRAAGLVRTLNKYFSRAWIKAIKTTLR